MEQGSNGDNEGVTLHEKKLEVGKELTKKWRVEASGGVDAKEHNAERQINRFSQEEQVGK